MNNFNQVESYVNYVRMQEIGKRADQAAIEVTEAFKKAEPIIKRNVQKFYEFIEQTV